MLLIPSMAYVAFQAMATCIILDVWSHFGAVCTEGRALGCGERQDFFLIGQLSKCRVTFWFVIMGD